MTHQKEDVLKHVEPNYSALNIGVVICALLFAALTLGAAFLTWQAYGAELMALFSN